MYTISHEKVFHYDVAVKGASAQTFMPLNNTWAKDDKNVYCNHRVKRVQDPSSFEALNECYGRDKFQVYLPGTNVPQADSQSFTVLDAGTSPFFTMALTNIHRTGGYAKDKNAVYFTNVTVKGADPATFQSLRTAFGVDVRDAYYEGKHLHVKHLASWRPISHTLSCDRDAVYFCNRRVKGADPRTVWLLLPAEDHFFRDHAAFYCNEFSISAENYYDKLEGVISHYTTMLSLFREGDYFSKHFRRSVPLDVVISDSGEAPIRRAHATQPAARKTSKA